VIEPRLATASEYARQPLVIVAILTFDRATLLRGCVAATLAQAYDDI